MAKAKYYLLTSDFIDGKEAERIGLVSLCVPPRQLMPNAMGGGPARHRRPARHPLDQALAQQLAAQAGPIFDQSLALEMLTFLQPDVLEGLRAIKEKRPPRFPSAM